MESHGCPDSPDALHRNSFPALDGNAALSQPCSALGVCANRWFLSFSLADLLRMFFDCLYDEEVISEDAFYKWESSKDPAEQNGEGCGPEICHGVFHMAGCGKQKRSLRITKTSNTQNEKKKQFKYFFKKFHVFGQSQCSKANFRRKPRVHEWEREREKGDCGGKRYWKKSKLQT